MKRHLSCLALALLWALISAAPPPALAITWIWTQSDWSGGQYSVADSIDTEIEPGELILSNDPDHFILVLDATDFDGIWTVETWQGQLYMGACDAPMSEWYGDIIIYDYASDSHWVDYAVNEEGICVLEERDGVLYSPGIDSMGSHLFGNLYYQDGGGWVCKETVPDAVHVHDVGFWDGRIWVATGTAILPDFPGILYWSDDMGETWTEEFRVYPVPPATFRRLYGITDWGGSLWVMSDFKQPEGKVIFEFTGEEMITHEIQAAGDECLAGFTEFQGRLVCLTRTIVDYYDGVNWSYQVLPVWTANYVSRAVAVYADKLYIGGLEGIISSPDAESWSTAEVTPLAGREFEDFVQHHGRLYAGSMGYGELFVTRAASNGTLISTAHEFPDSIYGGQLDWLELVPSAQTDVRFQLRSAQTEGELAFAAFLGPDGSSNSWYDSPGALLPSAHFGDIWFQYRVRLTSGEPRLAPVLQEFNLMVEGSATAAPSGEAAGPRLLSIWPNPFRAELHIDVAGTRSASGRLRVLDVRGRLVKELPVSGGGEPVLWDGRNGAGSTVSAGVYIVQWDGADGSRLRERVVRIR